ncbi:MAG: MFS transporter [Chloroflexota bacterium]
MLRPNSLSALNSNLARLLGPVLAGILVGLTGLSNITLIDTASFLIAAGLIALIHYRKPLRQTQSAEVNVLSSVGNVGREWNDGLHVVLATPSLVILFVITAFIMIAEGFFGTLIVPFVARIMHGTEIDFGLLMASQAIGGIIGSIFIVRIARTIPAYRLIGICAISFGILDLALFYYPLWVSGIGLGLLFIGLVGIPSVGVFAGRTTLIQTLTKDAYRGRVFGALSAVSALLMLVGAVIAGVLGERVNLILLLTADGLGYLFAGIVALTLLGRTITTMPRTEINPLV